MSLRAGPCCVSPLIGLKPLDHARGRSARFAAIPLEIAESVEAAGCDARTIPRRPRNLGPVAARGGKSVPESRLALRRVTGIEDEGVEDWQYAYVLPNGSLPESFEEGGLVPVRFRK